MTVSLWFYSKDKVANLNSHIVSTDTFKSFKCKAKLLRDTDTDGANPILTNTMIAVSLKNYGNFWRSLEMPLINCKVELKLVNQNNDLKQYNAKVKINLQDVC